MSRLHASKIVGLAIIAALAFGSTGCESRGTRPGGDGGTSDSAMGPRCEGAFVDSDGDGIRDEIEGTSDFDGDGTPNHLDTDSDNDGISDREEHDGANACSRPDTDGDGAPDWVDEDSDNDGLTDADEVGRYSTNPRAVDSDGDGVSDLGEVAGTMTDPNDPTIALPDGDFFVVLPHFGVRENRTLLFGTDITQADVFFLIDTTGSMQGAIDNVNSSLRTLATDIAAAIPNVQFGTGSYEDFPVDPYGNDSSSPFVSRNNHPFKLESVITADIGAVQATLSLSANGGADGPESATEAIYLTATGEGLTYPGGAIPAQNCVAVPDEVGRRRGYPCFRPGSLPIVVVVTDADFHNGNGGTAPYAGSVGPVAHSFDQAVAALNRIGARTIGVNLRGARADLDALARGTGSVDGTGATLVYDGDPGSTSAQILTGIETLVGGTPQDVTTRTANVAGNPDEFDATLFIKSIVPIEGYQAGIAGAGYASKDDVAFYGVIPGTQVEFGIDFYNDVRAPAATAQIFRARIIVVGNGVADLSARNVYIVVPPEGGTILI